MHQKVLEAVPWTVFEAVEMDEDFRPLPVRESTDARPGSQEKIEVLRQRAEDGVELFHPDDNPFFIRGEDYAS